jgi:glutathione S-transferase
MTPAITVFETSPDRGRGLARDMPVRWALEEVGQAYDVRLISFEDMKAPAHRARQPFGQIPTYEEGELTLFESGAIVLHVAQTRPGLLPDASIARARAVMWMFAAVNTLEPPIFDRDLTLVLDRDKAWFADRINVLEGRIRERLRDLSNFLGDADWLEDGFSAGDLMTVCVLRRLAGSSLLAEHPNVADYVARGEDRPAFKRAFAAQRAVFEAHQPPH